MNRFTPILQLVVLLVLLNGCGASGDEDSVRRSDLWRFAALGNVDGVQQLIERGTDLNALDPIYSMSALEMAAAYGQSAVVQALIDGGADLNVRNAEQGTPILGAAFFGRANCLQLLLDHGADPVLVNKGGFTPMFATYGDRSRTQMIADLLQMDIDLDAVDRGRLECRSLLGPYFPGFVPPAPAEPGSDSGEALINAVAVGDLPEVQRLIAAGADLAARNQFGSTPLGVAAFFGRARCLEALLAAGADPRLPNADGTTPMQVVEQVPWSMVKGIADSFEIPLEQSAFEQGRTLCRRQLREVVE